MLLKVVCLAVMLASGKCRVQARLPSASEGLDTIIKSWFPADAVFNESCVLEGCPALKNFSLCPNNINITVLDSILSTATDCMRKPICGIHMNRRPTQSLSIAVDEWLPGMGIDGTVTTSPGTGHLTNVSNNEFEHFLNSHLTHQLPVRITMLMLNVRITGNFKLDIRFRSMLPPIPSQALSITIPEVKYDIGLEYITTMLLNQSLSGSHLEIKLLHPIIKAHPMFCGLDMPDGFPSILTLFTSTSQIMTEKSSLAVRKAAFLKKYFQSAVRSIEKKC